MTPTKFNAKKSHSLIERVIEAGLFSSGILSILITLAVLAILSSGVIAFFSEVSLWDFFGDTQWSPLFSQKHFGIWPLVSGTILVTIIAISIAVPFGVLAAVYLSEFAQGKIRKVIKPTLEVLAGIPTIVYGYFALVFVTPLLQKAIPVLAGFNALSPGLVMGIMILPMISSLSEDAIHSVSGSLKEGSYALGASKLSTLFRVTIPTAFSGIMASVILAVSRAIGETMIVSIAAGQQPTLTTNPLVPVETMTSYIVQVSMGDTPAGTVEYRTIFVVGSMLFLMTFVMNLLSQKLVRRFRGNNV